MALSFFTRPKITPITPIFPPSQRQCFSSCHSAQFLTLSMLHYICKMTTEAFGKYGDFESNFLASCNDVNCSAINRTISPTVCLCTLGTDHWFICSKYCHGRRRRYGRHGSCRTTFERGTARQGFAVPYFSKKNSQTYRWFSLVNLTKCGPYVMANRFFSIDQFPHVDDLHDLLGLAVIFSKLPLRSFSSLCAMF